MTSFRFLVELQTKPWIGKLIYEPNWFMQFMALQTMLKGTCSFKWGLQKAQKPTLLLQAIFYSPFEAAKQHIKQLHGRKMFLTVQLFLYISWSSSNLERSWWQFEKQRPAERCRGRSPRKRLCSHFSAGHDELQPVEKGREVLGRDLPPTLLLAMVTCSQPKWWGRSVPRKALYPFN